MTGARRALDFRRHGVYVWGMKVAALLVFLAALPGHSSASVTPAQARANVVQALPPDIAEGAGTGDLRAYLERLPPDQKQAALRALAAKETELGDDPATLGVIGQVYAGLGKVKEARQAAAAVLRQSPADPDANRLMGWVISQEKLSGRGVGDAYSGGPGPGTRVPAAAGRQATLNDLERRIQSVFRRGQRSAEFKGTMEDARGMSVAELQAEGITFKKAEPGQRDAVLVVPQGAGFTISLRDDALVSGGDTEARAAAHVADGVRQAQTKRDHPYIGGVLTLVRGWLTGATVHKELAPNDIDPRPATPSDQNLMLSRKILDQKTLQFDGTRESYGTAADELMPLFNSLSRAMPAEKLLERLMVKTGRGAEGTP